MERNSKLNTFESGNDEMVLSAIERIKEWLVGIERYGLIELPEAELELQFRTKQKPWTGGVRCFDQ